MKKAFLFLGFLIILGSCVDRSIKKESFDYGKVVNGLYLNNFFNISINIPKNWVVQSKEVLSQLQKKGTDLVGGDNENLKAEIKASEINSAQLLMTSKYELGSPVESNPSFILTVENIKGLPGIKDGKDYLFHVKKLLAQTQLKYEITDDYEKRNLGGHEFYALTAKLSINGKSIEQQYFSTLIDGFCFSCILSFTNENEKQELNNVLNSLKTP